MSTSGTLEQQSHGWAARWQSLGLVWIPRDKRLRAVNAIDATLAGKLPVGEYRRLVGLLEHIASVTHEHRSLMDSLHQPMQAKGILETEGPTGLVIATGMQIGALQKWKHSLLTRPGATLLHCVSPDKLPEGSLEWVLRSDAMLEPNEPVGLGGPRGPGGGSKDRTQPEGADLS